MSSTFIDANDLDRLSRESQLTEQAPRVLLRSLAKNPKKKTRV